MKQTEIVTRVTYVNGWDPAVYTNNIKSKLTFVLIIEFIRYKLSFLFAHVTGVRGQILGDCHLRRHVQQAARPA